MSEEKEKDRNCKEIMIENFPNLGTEWPFTMHKSQRSLNRFSPNDH